MEDYTTTPKSDKAKPAQRSFLLTVIILLATLILSSLCVIGLLLIRPPDQIAASQPDLSTSTPATSATEDLPSFSPSATAMAINPTLSITPTQELSQVSHRIIAYAVPVMGDRRIIAYIEQSQGIRRIITYGDQKSGLDRTATETPRAPRRIINYDDDN